MTKFCLYCKKEKPLSEFSREHVLPRAVGGNLTPVNPFVLDDICGRCNNLCGIFVDAPFIKNWFVSNHRADMAKKYCHITPETVLPLVYMGESKDLKHGNKVCELWLGPTGDTVYHFHEPYPDEPDVPPMVGLPPTAHNKEVDFGFAFLFVRATNPVWHPAIVFSVMNNFKKAKLYLGNGNKPVVEQFEDIPEELNALHQKLKAMSGKTHNVSLAVGTKFADRFLCKLALGVGMLLLGEDFKKSKSADVLRKGMWSKNWAKEETRLPIRGAGFMSDREPMKNIDEMFKWIGGHSLVVTSNDGRLSLYANFYEQNTAIIQITDEPELWKGKIGDGIENGIVYVISPTLKKCVGPMRLMAFLGHRVFIPITPVEPLASLEEEMKRFGTLPPFDLK